jgi:hypothetical protein
MAQFRRGVVQFALGRGSRVGIFAKGVIKPKRGTSSMPTREVSWLRRTARSSWLGELAEGEGGVVRLEQRRLGLPCRSAREIRAECWSENSAGTLTVRKEKLMRTREN